jgi:hypothetical protein
MKVEERKNKRGEAGVSRHYYHCAISDSGAVHSSSPYRPIAVPGRPWSHFA